ncbi:MAG: Asp-tRNA(Asn)/Glu-tRNA(Gln) amidotransferase subunit GatA [Planctomycetia bacterium]|nr:MAG: Asp-tRNA(Asn)/Glu-tRNA(Gln) amidotransferase subunit GatA [Planctomycetia bacterium]
MVSVAVVVPGTSERNASCRRVVIIPVDVQAPSARVTEIARAVASRQLRAADVCRAALGRIEQRDPGVRAFLHVSEAHALARAAQVDAALDAGRAAGPLAGVPIAIKDNLCTRFAPTTAASRALDGFVPPYDATVVVRLEAAGAVIVGKTNLDEFAMGSSTENSGFFPTHHPLDAGRVPGGSSGGSAAAVASGMAAAALGSDTGGSVRQPAAFCGCVGLKPTYGRVSRYGLIAYGSSLDQVGILATNVPDAARVLEVIAGPDPRDATCSHHRPEAFSAALEDDLVARRMEGLRVGVPREYFGDGLSEVVRRSVDAAIAKARRAGARVVDVSLPRARHSVAAYYVIATAEASSNLARYDGVHYGARRGAAGGIEALYCESRGAGFGSEVQRRIMLGTFALSAGYYDAYYAKALRVRRLLRDDFTTALREADVLISPTTPTTAFRLGEKLSDPLSMYLADVYTIAVNLAGLPAISIPCGVDEAGLPIGLQLIGPAMGESLLLQAARGFERMLAPTL